MWGVAIVLGTVLLTAWRVLRWRAVERSWPLDLRAAEAKREPRDRDSARTLEVWEAALVGLGFTYLGSRRPESSRPKNGEVQVEPVWHVLRSRDARTLAVMTETLTARGIAAVAYQTHLSFESYGPGERAWVTEARPVKPAWAPRDPEISERVRVGPVDAGRAHEEHLQHVAGAAPEEATIARFEALRRARLARWARSGAFVVRDGRLYPRRAWKLVTDLAVLNPFAHGTHTPGRAALELVAVTAAGLAGAALVVQLVSPERAWFPALALFGGVAGVFPLATAAGGFAQVVFGLIPASLWLDAAEVSSLGAWLCALSALSAGNKVAAARDRARGHRVAGPDRMDVARALIGPILLWGVVCWLVQATLQGGAWYPTTGVEYMRAQQQESALVEVPVGDDAEAVLRFALRGGDAPVHTATTTARVRIEPAGELNLTSGKLAVADAEVQAAPALPIAIPAGRHPVFLAIAELGPGRERVAFARLQLAEGAPASWHMTMTNPQDDPGDGEPATYPVRSGRAAFRDAVTGEQVAFVSGWGDGSYPTYFGRDRAGKLVAVVTSFEVLGASYLAMDGGAFAPAADDRPPRDGAGWVQRTYALQQEGDGLGAEAAATRALELGEDASMLHQARAEARLHACDVDGAIADYTAALAAIRAAPRGPWWQRLLTRAVSPVGYDDLERMRAGPLLVLRSRAKLEKGDHPGALADAERALAEGARTRRALEKLSPGNSTFLDAMLHPAQLARAKALRAAGRGAEARTDLDRALTSPSLSWSERAELLAERADTATGAEALADRARALAAVRKEIAAEGHGYPAALAGAEVELGRLQARWGDGAGAIASFEAAVRHARGPGAKAQAVAARVELGKALLSSGEAARAVEALDPAIDAAPRDPRAWLERGRAKVKLGDAAGARADLEQAIARGKSCPEAVAALRALAP